MIDGVTVDANIMAAFSKDYLAARDSASRLFIEKTLSTKLGFAIDLDGKIQQEWLSTCGNAFFQEWLIQQMKLGMVRRVKPQLGRSHKKRLSQECGFPCGRDLVYIAVADATTTRYIVTEDIDFFEPKLKAADQKSKARARETRNGSVCRYLKTHLKIRVGVAGHAMDEVFP